MPRLRNLLGRSIVQNILALYRVQLASYLLPLLILPYLARVLEPEGFGLVGLAQSFALLVALIVEYGFNLSATREVARWREDPEHLTRVIAGVQGAKALLIVGALLVAVAVGQLVPAFWSHPAYLWWAWLAAVFQGLSPFWYFQGLERMRGPAWLEVAGRTLAALGVFALVHAPEEGWRVLALQSLGLALSTGWATRWMYAERPFRFPTWLEVVEALRMGFGMFFFRSAVSLYTTANAFVLGLFTSPAVVGYYAGAEKLAKAVLGLVGPVAQALFPRMSHLQRTDPARARRLATTVLWMMGLGGLLLGAGLAATAPLLISVLLGPGYEAAVPVLRVLALLLPLVALSNVLGIQWMLPLGLDRNFNTIIATAGLLNLGLAILLAPRLGALGMALAVVVAEAFVTGGMYLYLRAHQLDPLFKDPGAREVW